MTDTTIRVPEELADELHDRKERGDSYADVIWRLIEQADQPAARESEQAGADAGGGGADPEVAATDADSEAATPHAGAGGEEPSRGWVAHHLEAVDLPQGVDREAAVDAVTAAHLLLYHDGSATKGEIVATVMPDHPLGYDLDAALAKVEESGARYRGAWWRRVVKPGLAELPDVEAPSGGRSAWRHVA